VDLLPQPIEAAVIVDMSSRLRLLGLELKNGTNVSALKTFKPQEITGDDTVISSLKDFIRQNNIQHKNSILIPPAELITFKRVQLPLIPKHELLEAIKWQIKESLTFDISEAIVDCIVLKEVEKGDSTKILDCLAIAANASRIKEKIGLLKQAGLGCVSVIPLPLCYTELVSRYFLKEAADTLGILHLGEAGSFINIYTNKKLEFYRELPFPRDKLREALDLSKQQTEDDSNQAISQIRSSLERLAQEIKRSVSYYCVQLQGGAINKILLAGDAAKIFQLDKFLSKELSLNLIKIWLPDTITLKSLINQDELLECLAAIGAGLIQDKGINLLPFEFKTERIEKLEEFSLRWITLIAFLLLALSYFFATAGINAFQKRLKNANLQLNILTEVKKVKELTDEYDKFISGVKAGEPELGLLLKKLSGLVPKDVFLDELFLDSKGKSGFVTGVIKGLEQDKNKILSQLARNLGNSGDFTDISIGPVENIKQNEQDIINFKLSFKLR
ncbi:MAG: pilus assembly protein PilM, partial [Candidatus Omnitrophica bacterium]|nr:pilus assembly protein PilM [Candidatus Omnitrophota bacterium]